MKSKHPTIPTLKTVRAREGLAILMFGLALGRPLEADVIDASLKVRLNFDAAPVGDVIADTSPAGGHPGTNSLATWAASESGRTQLTREWADRIAEFEREEAIIRDSIQRMDEIAARRHDGQ